MEKLKEIFCRYDMVCDAPSGGGVEIVRMPEFFASKPEVETSLAHIHDFYEIIWFRKGSGVHHVDFNTYPVLPGTVFFISPGQVHEFDETRSQDGCVMKVCNKLLNHSSRPDAEPSQQDDFVYLKYNVFHADSLPYYRVDESFAPNIDHLIATIEEESRNVGMIGHEDYLRSLIRMLIITIERGSQGQENVVFSPSKTSHKTFLSFRQLIEQNYRSLHTVKDYAHLLGVSTKTLTNYVAECSPHSPLELINGRIILEAKRLLRYSNLMIKETAFRLGFDDPSYFVKFFKRIVGVSPIDFRERDARSAQTK